MGTQHWNLLKAHFFMNTAFHPQIDAVEWHSELIFDGWERQMVKNLSQIITSCKLVVTLKIKPIEETFSFWPSVPLLSLLTLSLPVMTSLPAVADNLVSPVSLQWKECETENRWKRGNLGDAQSCDNCFMNYLGCVLLILHNQLNFVINFTLNSIVAHYLVWCKYSI